MAGQAWAKTEALRQFMHNEYLTVRLSIRGMVP